jgi:hypothetical protein
MDEVTDQDVPQSAISWPRAILTGVLIAVVGLGLLAYGTNYLLLHLTSLEHGQRVGVATAWFFVVLAALAFGLRRLQRRGVI